MYDGASCRIPFQKKVDKAIPKHAFKAQLLLTFSKVEHLHTANSIKVVFLKA